MSSESKKTEKNVKDRLTASLARVFSLAAELAEGLLEHYIESELSRVSSGVNVLK